MRASPGFSASRRWPPIPPFSRSANRCVLELFLQRRELIAIRTAAIRLGMDVESFLKTLAAALENNLVSKPEAEGEFPEAHVYRASIIRIHKRFPNLAKIPFGDYPSFCRSLHEEIGEKLQVSVTTQFCPGSENSGDEYGGIVPRSERNQPQHRATNQCNQLPPQSSVLPFGCWRTPDERGWLMPTCSRTTPVWGSVIWTPLDAALKATARRSNKPSARTGKRDGPTLLQREFSETCCRRIALARP